MCLQRLYLVNPFAIGGGVFKKGDGLALILVQRRILKCLKTRAGSSLDCDGNQPVDFEAVADQLEYPQLLLGCFAVSGDKIAGDRIGSLAQLCRQCCLNCLQSLIEPVFPADQIYAVIKQARQFSPVEIGKYRKVPDDVPYDLQLSIGHVAVSRRHDDHRVDQRAVMIEHRSSSHDLSAHRPVPARACQARNRAVTPATCTNGTRATATPSGKAGMRRDGRARSRTTKTPWSSARRISRP